ncbi:hypothetical protein SAY86_008378 [Trapa natans]|uniref:Uncharacterized protein n=1 Tax=Trapa natans TaxID=22666 RepID=A0AAN7KH30_TRANT|nr:hypothetical protein SAY86_008378 [Trapa natans]
MREGLRSGKLRQRVQNDEGSLGNVVAQMLFGTDCKADTSVDIKDVLPESTGPVSVEDTVAEKLGSSVTYMGEVEDVNECELYDEFKFKKKRKREDDGEECQYPPRTGKYRVEEELSDGKVPITDWVLRSRMRPVEVEEQHIGKDDAP